MRLLTIAIASLLIAPRVVAQVFPIEQGVTWTYTAQFVNATRNRLAGGSTTKWTSKVIKTVRNGDTTATIVLGCPFDLAWYDPAKQERYTVIAQNKRGVWIQPDLRLSAAETVAQKAVEEGRTQKQLLRLPIQAGDCIADDGEAQQNHDWCWAVEKKIKDRRGDGWELVHRDTGGQEVLHIIPKVGIVRYEYQHRGAPSASARLMSMKMPAKTPPKAATKRK